MSRSKPLSPVLRLLGLLLLTLLISGQHLALGQSISSWRRDAGAVARSHVSGMINAGMGNLRFCKVVAHLRLTQPPHSHQRKT